MVKRTLTKMVRAGRTALLLGGAVVLVTWVGVIIERVEDYRSHQASMQIAAHNAALALDVHVEGIIRGVDQALKLARHEVLNHGSSHVGFVMEQFSLTETTGAQLNVFDPHGTVIASTTPNLQTGVNVASRPWFRHLRDGSGDEFVISETVTSRLSGRQVIVFARSMRDSDGAFAGMVAVSLDPRRLLRILERYDLGRNPLFGFADTEGVLKLGLTSSSMFQNLDIRNTPLGEALHRTREGFLNTGQGFVDGVSRHVTFRRLADYPLFILVGVESREALIDYWGETSTLVLVTLLLSGVNLMLIMTSARAYRKLSETARALGQAQDHLNQSEGANTAFLTSLGQELQAPLQTILGYATLLLDEERTAMSGKVAGHVGDILAAADHLQDIFLNLPGLSPGHGTASRTQAPGPIPGMDGPLSLCAMVDDCIGLTLPLWRDKGITLTREDDPGLAVTGDQVAGSATAIRQALLAMIGLAIHKSPQKSTIDIRVYGEGTALLVVSVTDANPAATEGEESPPLPSLLLSQTLAHTHKGSLVRRPLPSGNTVLELRLLLWSAEGAGASSDGGLDANRR